MYIGGVDVKVNKKVRELNKRKLALNNRELAEKQRKVDIAKAGNLDEYIESSWGHETENEDQYDNKFRDDASVKRLSESAESDSDSSSSETSKQMRVSLANLAREADRYGVSNRAAASLATAVLVDFGIVTNADRSKVIDKNKLRRERIKLRKQFQENARFSCELLGICKYIV